MLVDWSISPASACCSPFWVSSTPPPPLPPVPPPSLDEDRSTHSAMKLGPGTSPGRTGNSCSSYSGGQKNSCACLSTHTKPAPTASSASRMVAGPSEGPVGGLRARWRAGHRYQCHDNGDHRNKHDYAPHRGYFLNRNHR